MTTALLRLGLPALLLAGCSEYQTNRLEEPATVDTDTGTGPDDTDPEDTGVIDTSPPAAPDIEVDPTAYDAGTVADGTAISTTVTVYNVGDAPLTLGTLSSGWTLSPDVSEATLSVGGSVALTLTTTAAIGTHEDTLTIPSDDPDEPVVEVSLRYHSPDPCSWDGWIPDDTCEGGWPGTGADGDVLLTSWSPVSTTLTAAAGTTLSVADATGFAVDDEVLVHDATSGSFGFARVVAVGSGKLVVDTSLVAEAGAVVQRVPHYGAVQVPGALSGSRVVFRTCGTLTVDGRLSADGGGWSGGRRTTAIPEIGWQGESELGAGSQSDSANGTGGGGGASSCNVHADGGGGGHATSGTQGGDWSSYPCGGPGGQGGGTIGDASLTGLFFGGGGGGGYLDDDGTSGSWGGAGGAGGGLVYVVAGEGVDGAGAISANGADGEDGYYASSSTSPGGGGGGAGGTVWVVGDVGITLEATGGTGGVGSEAGGTTTRGGTGGDGRIRVDGEVTGSSTPAAYEGCE